MAKKVGRSSASGQFTVVKRDGGASVVEKRTGKELPVKGYGVFKDRYEVRKGVDITKPIYEQTPKGGASSPKKIKHLPASALSNKPTKKK
jgi:hypothetical protein